MVTIIIYVNFDITYITSSYTMEIIIPIVAAYIVYLYTFKPKIKDLQNRLQNINKKIEDMEKDEIIIMMLRDFKTEFNSFKKSVTEDMSILSKEVTTLKTKAGIISGLVAAVSTGVISILFKFIG